MINFLDNAGQGDIAVWISDALRVVAVSIDIVVYRFLSFLYRIFYYTADATIVEKNFIEKIVTRIGVVIAIFMLFSVAISFIKYVVDPDKFNDVKTGAGKLVTKILIMVALLALYPKIFNMAAELQKIVISENVISNIIFGEEASSKQIDLSSDSVGSQLAGNLFEAFLDENQDMVDKSAFQKLSPGNESKNNLFINIKGNVDKMRVLTNDITVKDSAHNYFYNYTWGVSTIIGGIFCWIMIAYIISIAIRTVQLAYLQIIAPIPIISYILPKGEDKLNTWIKQCLTTYFDLFIRLLIINLGLYLVNYIFDDKTVFGESSSPTEMIPWIKIALALGILMFMKKAPDLLKELFPSKGAASGDFGVSLKNRFKDNAAGAVLGGVAGGLAGMATGAIANKGFLGKLGGAFGGLTRGTLGGLTGKKTADIMKKTADKGALQRQGIGSFEQLSRNLGNKFGAETEMQKIDRELKDNAIKRQGYDTAIANNESKLKLAESIKSRATSQAYKKNISATIGAGKIKDAYNNDDAITFSDINRVKDSIERSRNAGNEFFTVDGREYHTSSADAFLKLAEKEAGKMVIASGTDNILNNNVREYDDIFFNIGAGPNDDQVDANHLYDSFTDTEERISAIRGTDDYKTLKSEQEELERQKSRVRGQ